jgi:hypothetical protein
MIEVSFLSLVILGVLFMASTWDSNPSPDQQRQRDLAEIKELEAWLARPHFNTARATFAASRLKALKTRRGVA